MEKIQAQESGIQKFPTEYKPEVLDWTENTYWKDFNYWWTIQQLRPWIEVEWSSETLIYVWELIVTWSWNISVTWVGFKPKAVRFDVSNPFWQVSGTWMMTTISQYSFDFSVWFDSTRCIRILWYDASYVSMDADWFTINGTVTWTDPKIYFTAFW